MHAVLLVDAELFQKSDPDCVKSKWPEWAKSEYSVAAALRTLGHDVTGIPATKDLGQTLEKIQAENPDFVFNLVEGIGGDRRFDSLITQSLELLKIPFTGATSDVLRLTRDKRLSKLVVADTGVDVPKGVVLTGRKQTLINFPPFPVLLKPLNCDGSEGVTRLSLVQNKGQLLQRLPSFRPFFPLLCEEYIPGRELIVTMSGLDKPSIDSICEMAFPESAPVQFATGLAKFDRLYRKRHGIVYHTPTVLTHSLRIKVVRAATAAYRALQINAYAKIEFRVNDSRIVFIEANANSVLAKSAKSTDFASIGYDRFIQKIIRMAFRRNQSL